jgi:hypothetical protein
MKNLQFINEKNREIINGFLKYIYQIQGEIDNSPSNKLLVNTMRLKKLKESLKILSLIHI